MQSDWFHLDIFHISFHTNTYRFLPNGSILYHYIDITFFFFFFGLHRKTCRILVPWPEIKSTPYALETQNLNHWTSREVPIIFNQTFLYKYVDSFLGFFSHKYCKGHFIMLSLPTCVVYLKHRFIVVEFLDQILWEYFF